MIQLKDIAYAKSGERGSNSNVGVIARDPEHYAFIKKNLTAEKVEAFFRPLGCKKALRLEFNNLHAVSFILYAVSEGGRSIALSIDTQGKALCSELLEMFL